MPHQNQTVFDEVSIIRFWGIIFCILHAAFLNVSFVSAQDALFSQHYASPLSLNPALTGLFDGDIRFANNYKSQGDNADMPYTTYSASCDVALFRDKSANNFPGLGIRFFSDKAGEMEYGTSQADISFAYHTSNEVNDQHFSAGLQAGLAKKSVNYAALTWGNQFTGDKFDPNAPSGELIPQAYKTYFDFSTGAFWHYTPTDKYFNCYTGVALFHANRPSQGLYGNDLLHPRLTIHSGGQIRIDGSHKTFLMPKGLYVKQGPAHYISAGMFVKRILEDKSSGYYNTSAIYLGCWYQLSSIVPALRIDYRNVSFGVSYDVNTTLFASTFGSSGGLELSLIYTASGSRHKNFETFYWRNAIE